jgi:NADPH-dependent F420 reductase
MTAAPPPEPLATRIGTVGILGGTGDQGRGLALRLAAAGVPVVIGSRVADRAAQAAGEVSVAAAGLDPRATPVTGLGNLDCARRAGLVVVAVPWSGHAATLAPLAEALAGKVVVDCVNPLGFDAQGAFALDVPEGSAALQAASLLPGSTIVAAFHHVSSVLLNDVTEASFDSDVMVLGDDRAATDRVQDLAALIPGMRGVYAGRLRNSRQVEALTANLISTNRRYKAHAGVRITDV